MQKRFSPHELYELRNVIPITRLIAEELQIPSKISEGVFRFLCPVCNEFQTGTHPVTNLARCFRCEKNFNTIDLVMTVKGWGFKDSVLFLQKTLTCRNKQSAHNGQALQSLAVGIGFAMPGSR
ncbi:CHC2 zinc finger [Desulfocicer vacuolatum DSM 3385]|uniref:CHC2 zinc finger n=1 Tax=Desulfocicer vacuolatum DSM 3385 TaxID=1121400 RepID=A0A1W2EZG1_9BACT|nr:CHC2 zinc finger domain-containing protein [Desulfocicer vacuolatum]SMD14618.1 CHC2 zinc finger [Desulfocicer vacuolatum DSM 3385]